MIEYKEIIGNKNAIVLLSTLFILSTIYLTNSFGSIRSYLARCRIRSLQQQNSNKKIDEADNGDASSSTFEISSIFVYPGEIGLIV